MNYSRLRGLLRHQISKNVIALYWVQAATFVVPLLTLPYISRVLRPSGFGLVAFSQSFSIFLTLFIDWGFTPYGVRKVAADRNDPDALADTVGHVRSAQLLMALLSAPIAIGALVLIPKFSHHPAFLAMAWVAAVSSGLMPNWYFVGSEWVRPTAIVQLGFRVIGAALTFVLVDKPSDAWIVMALYMGSSIGMWIFSDVLVYTRLRFRLRGLGAAAAGVRDSGRLFIGTIAVSLFSTFNVVLLGLFVSSAQVAKYAAGERILRTTEQILGPIGTAVYPRLAHLQSSGRPDRARRLEGIAFLVVGGIGALLAVVLGVFAPVWVRIVFGPKYVQESSVILRILVLMIPAGIVSYFAALWLMTLHRERSLVRIAIVAGVLNVALGSILSSLMGPQGMAWSVVIVQFVAAGGTLVSVSRIRDPGSPFSFGAACALRRV